MSTVEVAQTGHVLLVRLGNPPHALMDPQMFAELAAVARRADNDPDVTAVVLTGAHPTRFVAHFDVAQILQRAERSPRLSPARLRAAIGFVALARKVPGADAVLTRSPLAGLVTMEISRRILLSIQHSSAVWIAALNGDTGGGGCELALACDVRFMAAGDFSIAQPEVFLGFPPGSGGTQRLTHLLGAGPALRLCLDGGPLTPAQALELGLVDRVVAAENLVEEAVAEATRLGRRPKSAIGAIKRAVHDGGPRPLADGLRLETAEFLSAITSPDSITAQRAYIRRTEELDDLPVAVPEEVQRTLARGRFA